MKLTFPSRGAMEPRSRLFSRWDLFVIPLMLAILLLLTLAFRGASVPFDESTPDLTVNLDPANLPYYALRTVFRMFVAVLLSLAFTFTYATVAAKVPRTEKVLIPVLDFLQSLPILGFLTVTTAIFLGLFRGNLLGLEAASIFAIFTSQVWNMAFSFYHSLITTPRELQEAATVMRLSPWRKFWKLEVPFAMPGLIWNTMMSVSGGWFFVVASEVISVIGRDSDQYLPGVGSYVALAIEQANLPAMIYAAITLLVVILIYDQLIFRPIVAWSEKFKFEQSESQVLAQSWLLTAFQRSRFMRRISEMASNLTERIFPPKASDAPGRMPAPLDTRRQGARLIDRIWNIAIVIGSLGLVYVLISFMFGPNLGFADGRVLAPNPNLNTFVNPDIASRFKNLGVETGVDQTVYLSSICAATNNGRAVSAEMRTALSAEGVDAPDDLVAACAAPLTTAGHVAWSEVGETFLLGLFTMARVVIMIALSVLIWTPIGVWIGLRPRWAQIVQPFAQFAAAFPANLLFPIFVVLIASFGLNPNIWLAPLMVLGAQWYILFNVIAGTVSIPNDLKEAAQVMGLRGWAWWRTLIIPGIFPAFVTGGITASGGSWNASIVAEIASWGAVTLVATGLGAYISRWSTGEFNPHVALGMLAMGLFVLAFNRLLWRPLYALAEQRFRLD
jgi:NitT/TauT family transport system permease protein